MCLSDRNDDILTFATKQKGGVAIDPAVTIESDNCPLETFLADWNNLH